MLTTLASANAFGLSNNYYYRTNAEATGSGTVYAGVDVIVPTTATYASSSSTGSTTDSIHYVFAKPGSGQAFMYWTTDASTDSVCGDNPMKVTFSDVAKSTSQSSPAEKSFKAVFGSAVVFAEVNEGDMGSVKIWPASNQVGTTVRLTATPSKNIVFGSDFDGWYKGTDKFSSASDTTFTITADNQGTYVAKFKRTKGYFRIKSQNTSKYMKLAGTSYEVANGGSYGFYGAIFDNSVVLNSPVDLSDPGYIAKIDGEIKDDSLLENIEVYCQGLSLRDSIIAQQYHGVSITLEQHPDYAVVYFDQSGTKRFLKDGANYGYNCAIVCGGESDHQWTLEPVTDFKIKMPYHDFGYWTTFYTGFPYKIESDVLAYFVVRDEVNNSWALEDINSDTIPSLTPVVLYTEAVGKDSITITPVFEEPATIPGIENSILKGFININFSELSNKLVLGYDSDNYVDFILANSVQSNTAYIEPDDLYPNNARSFSIGNLTGIKDIQRNNQSETIYDLNGRKIDTSLGLQKGIYIINGRKVVK